MNNIKTLPLHTLLEVLSIQSQHLRHANTERDVFISKPANLYNPL